MPAHEMSDQLRRHLADSRLRPHPRQALTWNRPRAAPRAAPAANIAKPILDPVATAGLRMTARALKVTAVVDPAALAAFHVPNGSQRSPFVISIGEHQVVGEFNSKTLRRCLAAVRDAGPENVAVVVSGKIVGDRLEEAGILAQPRTNRSPPASESGK
jgi:hypothetical protein